ncbi:hypothetical protein HPB51_013494 [Rhipicephalus microplus]|uniref:RING-type domain-containing protein n=1 Tax=Rhipicephalus microplus TaxID=6941 RepID=A0A9J6END4_RHIMP|nr:hypothetical protein HPB51_013494 [Rhipicephalus microplus]
MKKGPNHFRNVGYKYRHLVNTARTKREVATYKIRHRHLANTAKTKREEATYRGRTAHALRSFAPKTVCVIQPTLGYSFSSSALRAHPAVLVGVSAGRVGRPSCVSSATSPEPLSGYTTTIIIIIIRRKREAICARGHSSHNDASALIRTFSSTCSVTDMYGSGGQRYVPTAGGGSGDDWQHAGDAVPPRETPDVATGLRLYYEYRVAGFGLHTDYQILEFLDQLQETRFCSLCCLVNDKMCLLPCLHVICPRCKELAFGRSASGYSICLIDKQTLSVTKTITWTNNVLFERVRCPNWGCDYTGYLKDLNDHLERYCAFYLETCVKCKGLVAYKDVFNHFMTCEGAPGVSLQVMDVQSNGENDYNACKDLCGVGEGSESVTAAANAINAVSELFGRYKEQPDSDQPDKPNQALQQPQ